MSHAGTAMLLCFSVAWVMAAGRTCDVSQAPYNAPNDGKTIATSALQQAIDDCSTGNGGGGIVLLRSPGVYLTGSLNLRSHTILRVERGATLLGSTDTSLYSEMPILPSYCVNRAGNRRLLGGDNVTDVRIEGGGTIDGGWADFAHVVGVRLMQFRRSTDVHISGVRLQHSGSWTVHMWSCDRVSVVGCTILNAITKGETD